MRSITLLSLSAIALIAGSGCDSSTSAGDVNDTADTSTATDSNATDSNATDTSAPDEVDATDDSAGDAASDTASEDVAAEVVTPTGTEVDSQKAAYHVWFDGPSRARAGVEIRFTVTILDLANHPVTGLALAPTYIHAEMGHGGPKAPTATEVGGGVYEVANLVASMAGTWQLKVTLPNADSARIAVTVTQ